MGCNSSRQEDIERDRQRLRKPSQPVQPHHSQPQHQQTSLSQPLAPLSRPHERASHDTSADSKPFSATAPLSLPSAGPHVAPVDESSLYGTSFTERRQKEFEVLHSIIQQARTGFVDAAARPLLLEKDELIERSRLYSTLNQEGESAEEKDEVWRFQHRQQQVRSDGGGDEETLSGSQPPSLSAIQAISAALSRPITAAEELKIDNALSQCSSLQFETKPFVACGPLVFTFEDLIRRSAQMVEDEAPVHAVVGTPGSSATYQNTAMEKPHR